MTNQINQPRTQEHWLKKIFNASTIGVVLALVSAAVAVFAFLLDYGNIVVALPGGNIENHTERNIVVFTNSHQTNLAEIPIIPEIHNPTNRTVNDFSLNYTLTPIEGNVIGMDISQSDIFSVNGNSTKLRYTYLQDNIKAFDKTGVPFSMMIPKSSYSASRIDMFCSHKGIKEPFLHGINIYIHVQSGSGEAWRTACRKLYESRYPKTGFEACYVEGKETETPVKATQQKATRQADIQQAAPRQTESVQNQATAAAQPEQKPIDIRYSFNNPDIRFAFKKCVCASGTAYIDIVIMNDSNSNLAASVLSQEPCAGYESWKTMVYDDEGNSYQVSRLKIGNSDRAIGSNYPFDLPAGVPVKARIYVSGVSDTAAGFALLKMAFRNMDTAEPYGAGLLQMHDIPISRTR